MAGTGSIVISFLLIGLIFVIGIILIILGFSNKGNLEKCMNNESLNCMTITCPSVDGRPVDSVTATCDMYAYRCVDSTHVMCSYNSGNPVEIDPADEGTIICSGDEIPCT